MPELESNALDRLATTLHKHVRKRGELFGRFSESGGMDPFDSSRISSNDSDGNEELGVQPYLYEPETNTEGNANITVLFYEITERVESEFWSFKKTQNKGRHNEKGLKFLCLSCQDINSDTMFLLMRKITACFHAVNTETVSMVWTSHFARKWTGLCTGVLLNGHFPWVFLALKTPLFFVGAFPAFLLSGNIVGIVSGSNMAL